MRTATLALALVFAAAGAVSSASGAAESATGPVHVARLVHQVAGVPRPTERALSPQQSGQRPVFRADISMVMVSVSVLDESGLPVAGLTADDFVLLEDGVQQRVRLVLTPDEVPADIGLLMDLSGSVRTDVIALKRDAIAFLDALAPEDCVHFMTFGSEIGEGIWGRPDDDRLRSTILEVDARGGTPLYDAIITGIEHLEQAGDNCRTGTVPGPDRPDSVAQTPERAGRPVDADAAPEDATPAQRRKALVVLTDGGDTTSQGQFSAAVNAAALAEMPIFPVAIGLALTEGQDANIGAGEQRRRGVDADVRVKSPGAGGGDPVKEKENTFDHTNRVARQSLQQRWDARMNSYGSGLAESLRELAQITGGMYVNGGESAASLRVAYNELLTWLRSSYVLGYSPPPDRRPVAHRGQAVWHQLEVRMRDPGYRVYARPGYFRSDIDRVASTAAVRAGVELLQADRAAESLVAFTHALDQNPFNWQAHFYRGRTYGVLDRIPEAHEDFQAAARLGPGIGPVHQFVAMSAEDLGDYETAWVHAIRAQQAGIDMAERFESLRLKTLQPADIAERLAVPRLHVGPAVVPDPEAQALLDSVLRGIRLAVSESAELGLVSHPQAADFFLRLQVDRVDTEGGGRVGGSLELREPGGELLYEQSLSLPEAFDYEHVARLLIAPLAELVRWLEATVDSRHGG